MGVEQQPSDQAAPREGRAHTDVRLEALSRSTSRPPGLCSATTTPNSSPSVAEIAAMKAARPVFVGAIPFAFSERQWWQERRSTQQAIAQKLRPLRTHAIDSGQIPPIGRWHGARFPIWSGPALDDTQ